MGRCECNDVVRLLLTPYGRSITQGRVSGAYGRLETPGDGVNRAVNIYIHSSGSHLRTAARGVNIVIHNSVWAMDTPSQALGCSQDMPGECLSVLASL